MDLWRRLLGLGPGEKPVQCKVADAPAGRLVEVSGVALSEGGQLLQAPVTRRPCVAWQVLIEAGLAGGWEEVACASEAVAFLVEDPSGRALVLPGRSNLRLVKDGFATVRSGLGLPEALRAHMPARGITAAGGLFEEYKALRLKEGVLEPGEAVAVTGGARWEPHAEGIVSDEAAYRQAPMRLVIEPREGRPVVVRDWPRDGG